MKRTYLTLIILMLVIGFAAVSTNLVISGKINIGFNEDEFNIYFSYASLDDVQKDELISKDKQTITFTATDSNLLEFDITNESSQYDAVVSVTCTPESNENYRIESNVIDRKVEAKELVTGKVNVEMKEGSANLEVTCTLEVVAISRVEKNTEEVKKRCEYDEGQEWTFDYKGSEQIFEVPCDGTYKLEAWGASGGSASSYTSGKGGYASGEANLAVGLLYINVGGSGISNCSSSTCSGGYNGGGNGGNSYNNGDYKHIVGAGGGATHIATSPGLLSTLKDKQETILLVAGAGGGSGYYKTYSGDRYFWYGNGGDAGGLTGYSGSGGGNSNSNNQPGSGATQISGNAFGLGGSRSGGGVGGGGGYYGATGGYRGGAGGGSSYISSQLKNTKMIDGQGYEWTTTKGVKINMPTHDGTSTMIGNSGNGYAKITLVNIG